MSIREWVCSHRWKQHTKKEYEWEERSLARGTEYWIRPIIENNTVNETIEVLICEKCGKIKTVKY